MATTLHHTWDARAAPGRHRGLPIPDPDCVRLGWQGTDRRRPARETNKAPVPLAHADLVMSDVVTNDWFKTMKITHTEGSALLGPETH